MPKFRDAGLKDLLRLKERHHLGSGACRDVYTVGHDRVLKVNKYTNHWAGSNVSEWNAWQEWKDKPEADYLAKCIDISPDGNYLLQERHGDTALNCRNDAHGTHEYHGYQVCGLFPHVKRRASSLGVRDLHLKNIAHASPTSPTKAVVIDYASNDFPQDQIKRGNSWEAVKPEMAGPGPNDLPPVISSFHGSEGFCDGCGHCRSCAGCDCPISKCDTCGHFKDTCPNLPF